MRNTKNLLKVMGIVSAAVFLFAINTNAGGKVQTGRLKLNAHKKAQISQPRAPTVARHVIPDPLQISGLSPQPEPPDLPLAFANPSQVAGLGPQPEPPDLPLAIANPVHVAGATPLPDPPTLPISAMNPTKIGGINPQPEPPGDPRAGTPMPIPPSSPVTEMNPATKGGINPQPEPPREGYFMRMYLKNAGAR